MANILGILRTHKWQNIYFEDQIKLCFKTQALQIEEVFSKNIYSEIRARYETELDLLHYCEIWRTISRYMPWLARYL